MIISATFTINVLMRRAAIEAVKAELRSQGVKVTLVRIAEIHRLAREYLSENEAQLIAQAKQKWSAINNGYRGRNEMARRKAVSAQG
jgi:hypothetical protein